MNRPGSTSKSADAVAAEEAARPQRLSVVGIGASAGGLRALRDLFAALPADTGMTFVVIVHLSPEHESMMAELLQPHTRMPVQQVTERVEMAPDQVFVIAPGRRLVVTDSHLELAEFEQERGRRLQIDSFFHSLAEHHGDGAAIILSGTGSDGAAGIKDIKEGGGLILVQAPGEAEYDGMPRSAIATGLVDVIAPVAELAEKLVRAKRTKAALELPPHPDELDGTGQQTVSQILTQLRVRLGHNFSGYKESTILRRIGRRMQLAQVRSLPAYLQRLRQDGKEVDALYHDLLIHVTDFFRDPEAWEALAENIVPQLFAPGEQPKGRDGSVRVWSVGCATGEEAYSLAILLLEHAATLDDPPSLQIFASDPGQSALSFAREGVYPEAIAATVSEERLRRFFKEGNGHYRVRPEVREIVLFAPHNLLQDPPFSRLDLIVCRNLLIYLQREAQKQVFESFYYALNQADAGPGYLFLGSSETAEGVTDLFEPVDKRHRIDRPRPLQGQRPVLPSLPVLRQSGPVAMQAQTRSEKVMLEAEKAEAEKEHRLLLEERGLPSLLVDESYRVLHLSETAGRYLQHPGGTLTEDARRLVRSELQESVRMALHRAFARKQMARTPAVPVHFNGEPQLVTVLVRPDPNRQRALLVFLEEADELVGDLSPGNTEAVLAEEPDAETKAGGKEERIEQLEAELGNVQKRFRTTLEEYEATAQELRVANQERQSTDEEYRTTLEELETSREELQSVNEELQTVNQELKDRMEETSRAHSDLHNLFTATEIATLFLDQELCIKRYTPHAADLFNLMPAGRGRPISHLRADLAYAELEADARQVLRNLAPVGREVQAEDGRWFLVTMRPYRTVDDRIEGVVITFVDITANKESELAERQAREYAESIVDTVPNPLLVLETDLRVRTANDAFCQTFQVQPEETEGRLVYELGNGQWDIPELRTLLEEVLPDNKVFVDYQVEHEFQDIGQRTMLLNGRRLDHVQLILLAITDITRRKETEREVRELNQTLEQQVEERSWQVRSLVTELTMSEQEERRRISGILHDNLQQRLYSLQFQVATLHERLGVGDGDAVSERVGSTIDGIEEELDQTIRITRNLSVDLSPPVLYDEGLAEAIGWLAIRMDEQHGLALEVRAEDGLPVVGENVRVMLFQIVRELLFNVVKHAGVLEAIVTLSSSNGWLHVEVLDQGEGFDVDVVLSDLARSIGLDHSQRRLELIGGRLQVESTPGQGTRVILDCPLEDEVQKER